MISKRVSVLCGAALVMLCNAASAATITFQFIGTVTYGAGMAVPAGTPVVGTFTYNTEAVPEIQYKGFAAYNFTAPSSITLEVAGHVASAGNLGVSIWNHNRGNVEDMMQVGGSTLVLDGTTMESGGLGFSLGSAPRNNRPLNSTKLPSSYDVGLFNAPGMTYGYVQADGGSNGTLLQFSMDSITVLNVTP